MATSKAAKKKAAAAKAAAAKINEIPEGSIARENLGQIVYYRDENGTVRVAIVSSVADDGRTVGLHVFDPGQRPDRNLLRAKEGTGRGQFSFTLEGVDKAVGSEPPDSDEDHTS